MKYYGVFGNPIAHSKSPLIHGLFAKQTGQAISYKPLLAPLDSFPEFVTQFFVNGSGANVTVPFKEQAFALADQLVNDLLNNHVVLAGKKILILGAGGAVRGVLEPLLAQSPAEVCIVNRTVEKAEQLACEFADLGHMTAAGYDWIDAPVDIIINGTSASLGGELPPLANSLIKAGDTVCYDMMYGKDTTVFNQWAQAQGAARTLDGLGMLVEQAAEAFFVWTGVRPNPKPVLEQLRAQL